MHVSATDKLAAPSILEALAYADACRHELFPLPRPPKPHFTHSGSHRLCQRSARKMEVWKVAVQLIGLVNSLHEGCPGRRTWRSPTAKVSDAVESAWRVVHALTLQEASRFARERRGCGLIGAHSIALL